MCRLYESDVEDVNHVFERLHQFYQGHPGNIDDVLLLTERQNRRHIETLNLNLNNSPAHLDAIGLCSVQHIREKLFIIIMVGINLNDKAAPHIGAEKVLNIMVLY